MGRNVEIKARVTDLRALALQVEKIADEGPVVIEQEDTFFHCRKGRFKLRTFSPTHGELIFYEREDTVQPKESNYRIVPTADPSGLREMLASALGTVGVVRKRRTLYLIGQTRIHLDVVADLGEFLELEVVLYPEQTENEGRLIAEDLVKRLQIPAAALVEGAYIDLLSGKSG